MKHLIIALTMALGLLVRPGQAFAQKDNNPQICNMQPVNLVRDSIENITQTQVNAFLLTFDSRCHSNIEFSESSNAMLFKLLIIKPEMVIYALDNVKDLNKTILIEELKEPFLEPDYSTLFSSVQGVKTKSKSKSDIIHAITEARSNR